jgi:hypothetical protein
MSTDLVPIELNQYPTLVPDSRLRQALQANTKIGAGFEISDLERIKTPTGGQTKWLIPTVTGEEVVDALIGIPVYFGLRGILWPSEEPTMEGLTPLLVTTDLLKARRVGDDYGDIDPDELEEYALGDGWYDWTKLPWNQWGSGPKGVGTRCKESRVLAILREKETFPKIWNAPRMSSRILGPFIRRLPIRHYEAVISLGLQAVTNPAGQPYSVPTCKLVGDLGEETGKTVYELYTDPITKLMEHTYDLA